MWSALRSTFGLLNPSSFVLRRGMSLAPSEVKQWELTGRIVATPSGIGEEVFRDAFEEEYNPKGERMPTGGEGMTPLPKYKEIVHVIRVKRFSKVTKQGKRLSFGALIVSGNGNGFVGMGVGKAGNPQKSIENAIVDARKHMILVPRHEGSLLQPLKGKYGASKVIMRPKKPGQPIVANRTVRSIFKCAGLEGISAKVHGSRTDHVMVRAALRTLSNAESIEMIAQKTGQRVQDVERDYKKRFHQPVRLPVARAIV